MKIDFNELRELVRSANIEVTLNKLDELEYDMIKEILLDSDHYYATKNALEDEDFREKRTLVAYGNNYYVRRFTDVVLDYGYDSVNSILLELLDEKLKEEANEENKSES